MASEGVSMPGAFGGLMRFSEEYDSKIKFKPGHVIAFVVAIILFVLALNLLRPIA